MSKRFLCSMVAVAALAACGSDSTPTGSDLCSKATTVFNNFNTKNAACFPGGTGATAPTNCTQSLTQCSSTDQAALNTFLDCINGLPACTIATQSAWGTQADACNTTLSSALSQACKTATGAGT